MDFPDVMTDIETTGTDPSNTAMIQLASVRFNYEKRTIGPIFNRCLKIPANRRWDEDTRDWWMETNPTLLASLLSRGEDPQLVMGDYQTWLCSTQGLMGSRMWCKPASFDFPFVQSYSKQFDVMLPFHFRDTIDLNSFCRGMAKQPGANPLKADFDGTPHDGVDDCLYQIKVAFMAESLVLAA